MSKNDLDAMLRRLEKEPGIPDAMKDYYHKMAECMEKGGVITQTLEPMADGRTQIVDLGCSDEVKAPSTPNTVIKDGRGL